MDGTKNHGHIECSTQFVSSASVLFVNRKLCFVKQGVNVIVWWMGVWCIDLNLSDQSSSYLLFGTRNLEPSLTLNS